MTETITKNTNFKLYTVQCTQLTVKLLCPLLNFTTLQNVLLVLFNYKM